MNRRALNVAVQKALKERGWFRSRELFLRERPDCACGEKAVCINVNGSGKSAAKWAGECRACSEQNRARAKV